MTLLIDVLMCDRRWAQVIDNRPLSMLGNEISCSSARFVGLKNPGEQKDRERNYREITQREQRRTDRQTHRGGTDRGKTRERVICWK